MTLTEIKQSARENALATRAYTLKQITTIASDYQLNADNNNVSECKLINKSPFLVIQAMAFADNHLTGNKGKDERAGDWLGTTSEIPFNLPDNPSNNNIKFPQLSLICNQTIAPDVSAHNEGECKVQIPSEVLSTDATIVVYFILEYSKYA
jgi:hypothetical protein